MPESRYNDATPVYCNKCYWSGKQMDCIHDYEHYEQYGEDDGVSPMDYCPKCSSVEIISVDDEDTHDSR